MKKNERNAGRRKIKDRQVITVFVSGLENKELIKATAKSLQILEPKTKKDE
jgi:hypothetical protein